MNLSYNFISNIQILNNYSKCATSKPLFTWKIKKKMISNRVQVPLKRTHLTLKFSKVIWRHFWEEFYVKWNIDWTKDYRHMTNNYMNDKIKINKLSKQLQMKLSNFLRIIQNNKSSFMFRSYNSCILLYNILYWSFTVFGLILR